MSIAADEPRPSRLARRLTVMAALVALASVLITGVATYGLFRQGATDSARTALGRDADTVAGTIEGLAQRPVRRQRLRTATINRQLAQRQITSVVADGSDPAVELPAPFTAADLSAALAGSDSRVAEVAGQEWLIEGRQAGAGAVLLAQPADRAVAENRTPTRRLVLPLLLGLLGGGLAGWLMARQLVRPLARLVSTARRLSAGDRQVRAPADGPAEIAELATALNGLAAALESSEARQRRFLLDVSHELRTPLTAVTGYAEGLADGTITGPEVAPAAEVIRTEAARLSLRVDDLLALARMEADDFRLDPAPADLAELVRSAALAWSPRAAAVQVRLDVQVPPGPVRVTTDAERLRQAVDALADNALRVLAPGNRLILGCGSDDQRAWVSVSSGSPAGASVAASVFVMAPTGNHVPTSPSSEMLGKGFLQPAVARLRR